MVKKFKIRVNGREYEIEVEEMPAESWGLKANSPRQSPLQNSNENEAKTVVSFNNNGFTVNGSAAGVKAPMPGVVVAVKVKPGDIVGPQDAVVTIEAMKMENEITAGRSGVVEKILVAEGETVQAGQLLLTLK